MIMEKVVVFRVNNQNYVILADAIKGVNGKTVYLYSNGVQAGIVVDEIIEVIDKEEVSHKLTEKNKGIFQVWSIGAG